MVLSNSKGFSFIEIVFCIAILGIIFSIALPKFSSSSKICDINLSSRLSVIQNQISILFTKSQLTHQKINPNQIYSILKSISKDNKPECLLRFNPTNITLEAKSYDQNTIFYILPKDFSSNPKIFCNLPSNLCKKINHKTKKK